MLSYEAAADGIAADDVISKILVLDIVLVQKIFSFLLENLVI